MTGRRQGGHHRVLFSRLALTATLVVVPGCGLAGGLGAVGVAVLSGKDDDAAATPEPVTILTPATVQYDRVPIRYTLTMASGATADVLVEYSMTGEAGPFVTATEAEAGYNGDGLRATQAWLSRPNAITVDLQGNLYICDTGNRRIRRVDPAGSSPPSSATISSAAAPTA